MPDPTDMDARVIPWESFQLRGRGLHGMPGFIGDVLPHDLE